MKKEVHISSLVLQAIPDNVPDLEKAVAKYPYSELGVSDSNLGKLVVVLENSSVKELKDSIDHFEQLEGVLTAAMVYHHVDASPSLRGGVV